MIIPDTLEKHKIWLKTLATQAFLPITALLLISGAIGCWKVYQVFKNREPLTIEYPKTSAVHATSSHNLVTSSSTKSSIDIGTKTGLYVASRGGKSYYLPTCSGAKRLSDKNKVWFQSKEEAERLGYKPAKNCKV